LFIKKLAFDGFYPLVVFKKKIDFCCRLKKKVEKVIQIHLFFELIIWK